MTFDFSAILHGRYLELLLKGMQTTLVLFFLSWIIAFALAIAVATLRTVPFKPLNAVAAAFTEYHRNVPILVQLLIWYFGVPQLLSRDLRTAINSYNSELAFAVVALSLYSAAFMSEDLRSGMRAIHRQQIEAARALGLSFTQTLRDILLPQALRVAAAPLVSQSLVLFKTTSLAMAIGVAELSYVSREIESATFRTFEAFAIVSVIYIAGCYSIIAVGHGINSRYRLAPS